MWCRKRKTNVLKIKDIITILRPVDVFPDDRMQNRYSEVYMRLIPRFWNSSEGKRHVQTVDVKMPRPENDGHLDHLDARYNVLIRPTKRFGRNCKNYWGLKNVS